MHVPEHPTTHRGDSDSVRDSAANMGRFYELIEGPLKQVRQLMAEQLHSSDEVIEACLLELLQRQGKMLRPAMTLLCGKMLSPLNPVHIKLAAMTELIHLASLLHDDVIDAADLRRGKATANVLWGNTAAVLLGDFLLTQAFALGISCQNHSALSCLVDTAREICEGELCQNFSKSRIEITEDDYFRMIEKKTAVLFGCCCQLGAIASESTDEAVQSLRSYGLNIGFAFQIIDDLKDLVSSVGKEGKTLGTDLLHEKLTLPIIHWLSLKPEHKQMFIEHRDVCQSFESIKNALYSDGSIQYAIDKAGMFTSRAHRALNTFQDSPEKQSLCSIADYIISQFK